jgi:hypothetical protein
MGIESGSSADFYKACVQAVQHIKFLMTAPSLLPGFS